MDIFCPEISTNQNPETVSSSHHYQTIHLVDKDAYDTCTLNGSEQYVSFIFAQALSFVGAIVLKHVLGDEVRYTSQGKKVYINVSKSKPITIWF